MFKSKRTQRGFAAAETVLILVIVALIAFVAWYAFNTKSNTDNTLDNTPNSQTPPAEKQTSKTPSSTAKTATPVAVVATKTSSSVGQYLADTNGKTLYTYGADTTGVSNCTGSCIATWPIYEATASANLQQNITVITRSDNTKQYAYKGMPLYYYSGDTSAGMVTGDGVNNFHVAKP